MSLSWPRKRVIMAIHRWVGLAAGVFVVLLSITGLMLNHSERLGLNEIHVQVPFLLNKYNMLSSDSIESVEIGDGNTISTLDGNLYYNSHYIYEAGSLVGCVPTDSFLVVATTTGLLLVSDEGELIEQVDHTRLPFAELKVVGIDDAGTPVLVAGNGNWSPDEDWLEFRPVDGEFKISPLVSIEADPDTTKAILSHYQGEGPSLYRVLLDAHSGRLFGWKGRTVMDITAVAMLLLVISGVSGWLRKSRQARP